MSALDYTRNGFVEKIETVFSLFSDVKGIISGSGRSFSKSAVERLIDMACNELELMPCINAALSSDKRINSINQMSIGVYSIVQQDIKTELYQSSILPLIDEIMLSITIAKRDLSLIN